MPPLKDSTKEPNGISCETCANVIVNPLRSSLTDGTGSFVLRDVPVMKQLPIVVQVGKWRRLLHVDVTNTCEDNAIADGKLTLLKNGSEGDMPQIAVTTGGADSLECLLRGIGIDEAEFVDGDNPNGHIHLYKGGNGGIGAPALPFSNQTAELRRYDMVLLSCEGDTFETNKGDKRSLHEYLNAGGKVFASHYQFTWFYGSPAAASPASGFSVGGGGRCSSPRVLCVAFFLATDRETRRPTWVSAPAVAARGQRGERSATKTSVLPALSRSERK